MVFCDERLSQNPGIGNVGKLFNRPEIRMDAEEQYEELLRLADDFGEEGIISREERRALIEKATVFYAQSVAGVGEGT